MTDLIEDAATPVPAAPPWTPRAGPLALSKAKIAEIKALAQKADQLVEASLSENTRIAYGKAWRAWSDWCLGFGLDPTGENSDAAADERWLVMHLTALSEKRSLSTILLRRAAVVSIRKRLKRPLQLDDAGFEAFLKGLRRTKGARPVRKAALLEPNLRAASLVLTPDAHPDLAGAALAWLALGSPGVNSPAPTASSPQWDRMIFGGRGLPERLDRPKFPIQRRQVGPGR